MKPNAIKSVLAAAVCLASMHSQAQNVSKLAIKLQSQKQQMWSVGRVAQVNPEIKTQEIYKRTLDFLKSPNRVQKMGGMDGGGGNALLCNENGKYTAELLDVYEARSLGVQFELGGKNNMLEILDHVFNRLSKVSPLRATVYSAMARDLLSKDTQWVSNKQMPVIDDVNLATIPQDCLLVQVAIQRPLNQKNLPNAKTYIIDTEMFNLLDETSRAALVLHEVLYREARHSEIDNSLFTRHLVGLIMSQEVLKFNIQNLNKLYTKNHISCMESIDTPTLESINNQLKTDPCGFINDTNFKISFTRNVNFQNFPEPFTLQEKWTGQTRYRNSGFNKFLFQYEYLEYNFYNTHELDGRNGSFKTTIGLDGVFSLSVNFGKNNIATLPPISIEKGSIDTELPTKWFEQHTIQGNTLGSNISPYTSSNINYFTSKSNISNNSDLLRINETGFVLSKFLGGEKLTFSSKNLRIENTDCRPNNENCHHALLIGIDSKLKTFFITASFSDIQIYHPAALKLNLNKEIITSDGWVTVNQIRFNPDGSVAEYEARVLSSTTNNSKIQWIKYE